MKNYDLGIIGGMGSEATVELYNRIINKTVHSCDQEHMRIVVLNNSIIPDRTKCILNNEESPVAYLNQSITDLDKIGVNYYVIPCNTAHHFIPQLIKLNAKFISMIEETLDFVNKNFHNYKVCILATEGTLTSKVYHDHPLAKKIEFVHLNNEEVKTVMDVIVGTKSDFDRNQLSELLVNVVKSIKENESNCLFILACTELSLYLEEVKKHCLVIDAMDCLVNSAITKCGYKVK